MNEKTLTYEIYFRDECNESITQYKFKSVLEAKEKLKELNKKLATKNHRDDCEYILAKVIREYIS